MTTSWSGGDQLHSRTRYLSIDFRLTLHHVSATAGHTKASKTDFSEIALVLLLCEEHLQLSALLWF